ncbi:hypothetical protein [Pseudoflavonifractor sp. 60]|nr:hypothetical protein [Pseudoflavonifractor sp. 60]
MLRQNVTAVNSSPPKGGESMSLTITLTVNGYTITLKVKKDSRHSAK